MTWMNEYDIDNAVRNFDPFEVPNLAEGARVLDNLMRWTNENSDGWPYWVKPQRAAKNLMDLLQAHTYAAQFGYYQGTTERLHDVTKADLTKACGPIKSFLTRQGVSLADVFAA